MHIIGLTLYVIAIALNVSSARAEAASPEWIDALRAGGHVIVFRHGATHQDQADTDPLNIKNVDKQRHLNDSGRALAKSIGDSIRKLKIPVAGVYTSMFQRAVDTGSLLGFGEVTSTVDVTEGGLVVTPIENNRRAEALRKLAGAAPPAGGNIIIISHKPNIMDAFGKEWFDLREGEASIFRPDGGGYKLVARVQADQWSKLAP
ncbi:MAG TPA: histidine phosphatase family protein [Xanthobacteraceae bacterium]|nr:histidine phosphatase family protein [Xanthobacteraceae bacterium]